MGLLDTITKVGGALNPVASIVGGVFNWLSGKSQADAQKEYNNLNAKLYNQWLVTRDQKTKDILDQLQAHGQDIYGPQKTTSTQEGTTTSNQRTSQSYSDYEAPEITAEYQPMAQMQRALVEKQLSTMPTGAGLSETNAEAQNRAFGGAINNSLNLARERGQSADAAMIGNPADMARRGAIASYDAQVPFILSDEARKRSDLASGVMAAFGRATRRTGQSTGVTSGTSTSNMMGTTTGPVDYNALLNFLTPPAPQAATMK